MDKKVQFNFWYVVLALFGVLFLQNFWQQAQQTEVIPYSEFERLLAEGKVGDIVIGTERISGDLKTPEAGKDKFVTIRVDDSNLVEKLGRAGVKYTGTVENTLIGDILGWVVPVLLFFGLGCS